MSLINLIFYFVKSEILYKNHNFDTQYFLDKSFKSYYKSYCRDIKEINEYYGEKR